MSEDQASPVTLSAAPPMGAKLGSQLSIMMFLQYAIWGAWLPILYPYLMGHIKFELWEVGVIFSVGAVGAIVGPFMAGQIADRYFSTEKFLALSHLIGAVLVWFLASLSEFWPFVAMSLLYGLVYAPTLALTNSLAFHHMPDRDRDFGRVRVWGTVGWIAVGIGFGHYLANAHTPDAAIATADEITAAQNAGRAMAFRLSSILGVIMAGYCLTLPKTPPSKNEGQSNATFEALGEVKKQPLLTLFLLAVPISMIHQFYFVHTSQFLTNIQNQAAAAEDLASSINKIFGAGGGGLMTIGQMTELVVLALIPLFAKRFSRKSLLAVGLIAYAGRMALFAYAPTMVPVIVGVALHGLCFGCFIFVAFMVVDEECAPDIKASAQNLFNLVIVGIGIIVGSLFATEVVGGWATETDAATGKDVMNYVKLFSVPMWMAIACLVALIVAYPNKSKAKAA